MPDFQGRRIVLTGVSRGIGLVCARALLEQGAAVLGVGRDSERLNRAIQELSQLGDFAALRVDVGAPRAAALVAGAVQQRWGVLDVLVNNAAVMDWRANFEAERPETLEQTLRVNLIAAPPADFGTASYVAKKRRPPHRERELGFGNVF